jgi:hypothetical protein
MVELIEMFLDLAMISASICVISFLLSKRGTKASEKHRERMRRFCIFGIINAALGVIGEIWLHLR